MSVQQKKKVGIIVCDRYRDCAGGKCLRSLKNRERAFSIYKNQEVELVGYTTCGGCPGGNIEYCVEEMKKNGVDVVHFATGMVVGYPPCPYIDHFKELVKQKYGVDVIIGTHPIPQSYYNTHTALKTWSSKEWKEKIKHVLADESMRKKYSRNVKNMRNIRAEMSNRKASDPKNKPDEILEALELRQGQKVADIGAGGGYFSLRFSCSQLKQLSLYF